MRAGTTKTLVVLLPLTLSGCLLDYGSSIALQAYAPDRPADDVVGTLDRMLTSLGTERYGDDRSKHRLNGEFINIETDDRPGGTLVCIEAYREYGTLRVNPDVVEVFAQLRTAMATKFGEEFVAPTPCHADEPYWLVGDRALRRPLFGRSSEQSY